MLFQRGKTDEAIEYLKLVVEINQQEPGCNRCAMHRDVDDPDVIVIVERWDSRDAYELHLEQRHIHDLAENTAPLFAGLPRISITEPMTVGDESLGAVWPEPGMPSGLPRRSTLPS
jgi:quinol monooxygenase YgiN